MRLPVDSSVFIAALKGGEIYSANARTFFRSSRESETIVVPLTVVVEIGAALRRYTGNSSLAKQAVGSLKSWESVQIVEDFSLIRESLFTIASTSGLRGMDAIVLGMAFAYELPLLTFDRAIIRLGNRFVRIVSIEEALNDFD